jgi:hypothetical protein
MSKWLAAISCCFCLSVSAQQAPVAESQALKKAYQQALYAYYQGDFFQALTQLAILEQRFPNGLTSIPESLVGHQMEPELLKGGISLSYGLDNQAADIFTRLLASNANPETQSYAWLLLGKTYFQNRQFEKAAKAFAQIDSQNAKEYFDQLVLDNWVYMQSQLYGVLSEQGASAPNWLAQLSSDSIYRQYVSYNQALALLQNDQTSEGIKQLDTLAKQQTNFVQRWVGWAAPLFNSGDATNDSAERETIRDRANLTLGYTLLQNQQPHQAYRAFENIRTDGLDAQPALLGYGWAAAKKDELQIALAIWQSLMQLPQNSEYVLEAYLASAYAYEQAFAPRQSLAILTQAISRFEQSLSELDQASQQVNQRQFILDLLADPQATSETVKPQVVPQGIPVNASQLFESVVVSNEFRAGLLALQQSVEIQQQLNTWQQQMLQYELMLDERQVEQENRAQQILQDRTLERLSQLQATRDVLSTQLSSAIMQQDGQIFMPQKSQDWLARITKAQQRLDSIEQLNTQFKKAPLDPSYQQRLSRVKGRLIWQASEALPVNQWQAQKALADLDGQISLAQTRQAQLLQLLADKPNFDQDRKRVSDLAITIEAQLAKNTLLQDQLVGQLSTTFNQFILAHKQKVQNYLMQAQLAIVRLSDQALLKDNKGTVSTDFSSAPVNNEGDQE